MTWYKKFSHGQATHYVPSTEVEDEHPESLDSESESLSHTEPTAPKLYPCPEPGCTKTYNYEGNLARHVITGMHDFHVERETLLDAVIGLYERSVEHLQIHQDYSEMGDALKPLQGAHVQQLDDLCATNEFCSQDDQKENTIQ